MYGRRLSGACAAWTGLAVACACVWAGPVASSVGDGLTRWDASAAARDAAAPSFALVEPLAVLGPGEASPVRVVFGEADGRQVASIEIPEGTSLYGTGQAAGPLRRNGRVVECWNTDAYGYQENATRLYTSHPWVLAVRPDGTSFGVLADTTWRCEIDLREGIVFRAEGTAFPVYVFEAEHPQRVVEMLAEATGKAPLPPLWALGYHQCRYSYYPESRVKEIAREFRARDIPCDVIWFDIDYMDGFRVFTFDRERFPDPARLNRWLDRLGFSNIWMIDPGVKDEDGYFVSDSGDAADAWVRTASGEVYNGEVWPGMCVFPDYLNAGVREWWAGLYPAFMAYGIDGVWNDMNEPAVFNVPGKTMPDDVVHRADEELGGTGPHARYHNVYGKMMIKATREGILRANPDKRPFVLSRSGFVGTQRYAATWTGDNTANWSHLDMSVSMILNLGLSGQPTVGPDIGGFIGAGTPEMYARWMGVGAMYPFARGHTGSGNIDKEPWAFGPEVEATSRRALERRYRLLPYFYTLFEEASRVGTPVARPVFFTDPSDAALRQEDDAFLLGADLLVAPQHTPARDRVLTLPKPERGVAWRKFDFASFDGGRDSKDADLPELSLRPGSIVPSGPVIEHVRDRPNSQDELTLLICLDADGRAEGWLYEDAGDGFGYEQGDFLRTRYEAQRGADGVVTVRIAETRGERPRSDRVLVARVLEADGTERVATGMDGEELRVR